MKLHFSITLISLLLIIHTFGQPDCTNGLIIESPVVAKPTEANIASVNCSAMVVKWKGAADQKYLINATAKEAGTNTVTMLAQPSAITCDNDYNCTATIPVTGNTYVSWSVQAVSVIDGRTFYSYPLRGEQDYQIPNCPTPVAPKDNVIAVPVENEKLVVKMYPNPVRTILNINVANTGIRHTSAQDIIRIFDVNGRLMMLRQATEGNTQINVQQLIPGTYFIRMESRSGKVLYSAKFIKE